MILNQDQFNTAKHKENINLQCDYCGAKFTRKKSSIVYSRKSSPKDACPMQSCRTQKVKETSIAKYGVDNFARSDEFNERFKITCMDKYGVDNPNKLQEVKEKIKQTNAKRYGVDHPSKCEDVKERRRKTNIEKYGSDSYFNSNHFKKIMQENFDCETPSQSKFLMSKARDTRQKTLSQVYGVKSPLQLPESLDKARKTCELKYGVSHYSKSEEWHQRVMMTSLKKFGQSHYAKTDEYKSRQRKTLLHQYGSLSYPSSDECKERMMSRKGVPYGFLSKSFTKHQTELQEWLRTLGFEFTSNYDILNGREIDLYNPQLKLGIEYCGLYWHTEMSRTPRGRTYHFDKYKGCIQNAIRLITIFGDEWCGSKKDIAQSIIQSRLGCSQRIFARKCYVKELDKLEYKAFCNLNHMLGGSSCCVAYGLFLGDNLLMVLSLDAHHRQFNRLVLNRLCTKKEIVVVGGVSRLLKQVKSWAVNNGYAEIITWSDNRWSDGSVYEKVGFIFDAELPPDYSYVDMAKPYRRISKQSQKKSSTGCPKDITEREWALSHGLARIWDCGKKRWKLTLSN